MDYRLKVMILAVLYLICVVTMWTAPSMTMGNASMRVLSPPIRQHCKAAQMAANKCLAGDGCQTLKGDALKCEQVVQNAYRHINLGGCPMEIKAWTLCEIEWCQGGGVDHSSCLSECAGVRDSLQTCKENVVASYFKSHSLEKDGTSKIH